MNFKLFNHDNCEKEKQEVLKTFESTILKVLESVEKMNNKFFEMASKIETEHFKQLEKQSAKMMGELGKQTKNFMELLEKKGEPVAQKLGSLDLEKIENTIEKEDTPEPLLEEMPPMNMEGVKLQFEGEEEIFPIDIQK